MKYGIVLKEKEFIRGLERNDVINLFDKLNESEAFPIELEAKTHECSAMGFITLTAAETFDYDYKTSGLQDFISTILDDMNNETEDCEYEFRDVKIYLGR